MTLKKFQGIPRFEMSFTAAPSISSPSPGATTTTAHLSSSYEIIAILGTGLGGLAVLALAIFCVLRMKSRKAYQMETEVDDSGPPELKAMGSLIPPLFYTEDLRDPLMQEDLRERPIQLDSIHVAH
jgi:hypothetical protein